MPAEEDEVPSMAREEIKRMALDLIYEEIKAGTPIDEVEGKAFARINKEMRTMVPGWRDISMSISGHPLAEWWRLWDTHGDGMKRIIVGGRTYLVPIEDIVCKGVSGQQIPQTYQEAGPNGQG